MALPSQSERSTGGGRVSSRPGRGGLSGFNKPAMVALLILLAAGGTYAVYAMLPSGTSRAGTRNADGTPSEAEPSMATGKGAPEPGSLLSAPTGSQTSSQSRTLQTVAANGAALQAETGRPAPVDVTNPDMTARPSPAGTGSMVPPGPTQPLNPVTPPSASPSGTGVRTLMDAGEQAFAQGKLVEARVNFSRAYLSPESSAADRAMLRDRLQIVNADLMFSPKVTPGDPLVESYTVASGDVLDKIRRRRELTVDSAFIARVNGMANANNLKVGQKLKLVRGPFHAIVDKSDFRMDVFAGSPDEPDTWTFVRAFPVGLGENTSSTPLGNFKIRNKMKNPYWKNPRTGEQFAADNPLNPIGEYWLGWEGLGDSKVHTGFGLHGTIDPASIGQERSMGCVRMASDDIAMVFEMFSEQVSTVRVQD